MLQTLGTVTLKNGERVEAAVVSAPDEAWAPKLEKLLYHKGGVWNWQNSELLRRSVGIDVHFYILHRDGTVFSNILTSELNGVGLFGHVWTEPGDRGKGASSSLQKLLLADFRARGGRALYLGTGYGSAPYRQYQKDGFKDHVAGKGTMRLVVGDEAAFDREQGAAAGDDVAVAPIGWRHWPTSSVLFSADVPGLIRAPSLHLVGRTLTEGPFLPLIRAERERKVDEPPRAVGMMSSKGHFLGFAARQPHPLWPGIEFLDLWCHPAWWKRSRDLVAALRIPGETRLLSYADPACPPQLAALEAAGLSRCATVPRLMATDATLKSFTDVAVFER